MSAGDHAALRSVLEDPQRSPGTMTYGELQGFLFAVLHGPELVPMQEWTREIFDGREPVCESVEQLEAVIEDLADLNNRIAGFTGDDALPPGAVFADPTSANLDAGAPIADWARGFIRGHTWLEESWDALLPDELDEEVAMMTMTLSFFASRDLANAFAEEVGADRASLADTMRKAFPLAAAEYSRFGHAVAQAVIAASESAPAPAASHRIGRNEPCPCGSGRKYKKCCGAAAPH